MCEIYFCTPIQSPVACKFLHTVPSTTQDLLRQAGVDSRYSLIQVYQEALCFFDVNK